MKYGRLLKGPLMLTPKEFNETVLGDGIGFKTTEAKEMMRIPLQAEAQHIQLMGDTGAGKTTLIHLYNGNAALLTESLEVIQKTSAVILSALENPAEIAANATEPELAQAS
ncbi:hypothetical protein [Tunturiibacter gelidiferens]|uniref:hypothetical protein n=1 Tax=Tunturiibacter gelidiferens TaxID=3069689 RepID=UPI003D9B4DB4